MSEWLKVAKLSEIPDGAGVTVQAKGTAIALFRSGRSVHALLNSCAHRGGPLGEGSIDDGKVICPWHAWEFELGTGKCPQAPGTNQPVYPVKVEGEDVYIDV